MLEVLKLLTPVAAACLSVAVLALAVLSALGAEVAVERRRALLVKVEEVEMARTAEVFDRATLPIREESMIR